VARASAGSTTEGVIGKWRHGCSAGVRVGVPGWHGFRRHRDEHAL